MNIQPTKNKQGDNHISTKKTTKEIENEIILNLTKENFIALSDKNIENLKLENFSIFPGSELKLLKGLELGCSGIITATCNVTAELSRKVYDDFHSEKEQSYNQKLCEVRSVFDKYNLISGLHTYLSQKNDSFKNILPPLSLLSKTDEKDLLNNLRDLNFKNQSSLAA